MPVAITRPCLILCAIAGAFAIEFTLKSQATAVAAQPALNQTTPSHSTVHNVATALPDPSWAANTVTLLTITAQQGGHTLPVRSIAFSQTGNYLVTGSADKTVKIWDLSAQTLAKTLTDANQINAIAVSPDSRLVASGRLDGVVSLWDWQTGNLITRFSGHTDIVKTVAFSPDGQVLASGSGDKTIRLWDVQHKTLLREITTDQWIESLAFSSDGQTLVTTGVGRQVQLWNWRTGRLIRTLGPYVSTIYAIALSPNGEIAFSPDGSSTPTNPSSNGGQHNTIQLLNGQGRSIGRPLRGHQDYITSLAFSPSGRTLVTGSWDHTIRLWNVQTGELIRTFMENDRRILSVAFNPDGRSFAVGSGDGTIKIFMSTEFRGDR
ncbi:MAG TPA: WD40 repeat domain-containing protein [Crinalium sp.]